MQMKKEILPLKKVPKINYSKQLKDTASFI